MKNITIDFEKMDSLVPVIVQHAASLKVLMLGYMNQEAYEQTIKTKRVTFFSRSKNRIWVKGESSKNYLNLQSIEVDCDGDALLIKAFPEGPTCHTGTDSCFEENNSVGFIYELSSIIKQRIQTADENSYTYQLYKKGVEKVAQKVGEEAVETVIEAVSGNKEKLLEEASDLLFHYLVLLEQQKISIHQIEEVLKNRHKK